MTAGMPQKFATQPASSFAANITRAARLMCPLLQPKSPRRVLFGNPAKARLY
jgi:hypothetical protein